MLSSIVSITTKDNKLTESLIIEKSRAYGLFLVSTNKQELFTRKLVFYSDPIFDLCKNIQTVENGIFRLAQA